MRNNRDLQSSTILSDEAALDPDQYVSTAEVAKRTEFSMRFWENRRITGDTPPFIFLSKRCIRYRWGDVVKWMDERMRTSTADAGRCA